MRRVIVTPAFGGTEYPCDEYDYCVVNLSDDDWRTVGRMRKRLQGIADQEGIGGGDGTSLINSPLLSYFSYCHIFVTEEQLDSLKALGDALRQEMDYGGEAVLLNLEGEGLEEFDAWWANVEPLRTEIDRVEVRLNKVKWTSVPKHGESSDLIVSASVYSYLLFPGEQDDTE